jgi:hypothetical protein
LLFTYLWLIGRGQRGRGETGKRQKRLGPLRSARSSSGPSLVNSQWKLATSAVVKDGEAKFRFPQKSDQRKIIASSLV